MSIAWVFPGQGSQKLGMANSLLELPGSRDRFDLASQILGRDLWKICSGEGITNEEIFDLNDTRNTQPALFVVESLLVDDLKRQERKTQVIAGHSLGEIVGLYASEVLDAESALLLLKKRSELMAAAGGGSMIAVLGFDRNELDDLIRETEGAAIANDNSESQVVLSGSPDAVGKVANKLKCKRAIPLQVSGAFHSIFMSEASKIFAEELDKLTFLDAQVPILSNVDPTPTLKGEVLKDRLKKQMTTGVRWRETMNVMQNEGVTTMVEIGPGNVLSGLAKRSMKGILTSQISNASDLGY
ncbi:ACP S-malonyltransferase [Prochlorococcus marinus]|uniref:Malonyl CoA-acyl carrier protein transacylase n=1 Tax=Prochlorococcus marinus XMU1408 TaxID=2213228 RepID=A0A318RJ34_PROMR|nr:ACP S-malonyltransferase [Prochlorococcus marinus]MBW3041198.1 [acyl-carrier-protein] S-malonyltransferase [Prochlorococcus marinus str. XMU1408]PYE03792.1 [acyl-carrier-protein] S-malonyltransferase [Prochlorococcus marinus XMU1408]